MVPYCSVLLRNHSARCLIVSLEVFGCTLQVKSIGINIDSGTVFMNFIHDHGFIDGDHTNCIMTNGGPGPMTIQKNTCRNQLGQTSAIALYTDTPTQLQNRLVTDNLIAGGGYSIYGGSSGDQYGITANPENIDITNNRFSKLYYATGGAFGPYAHFDPTGLGSSFSGNVWDDDNTAVT